MKRKYELLIFCITMVAFSASQAQVSESGRIDSTFRYVPGEGTYIRLSKKDKFIFNINATLQPGMQTMDVDTGSKVTHTNRMSLNLVRLAFNVSAFNNQLTMGLVSDFTGTTGILEGWLGFASKNQQYRLVLGERQTNTNNRLAMADEKFASVMGPTTAGKSTDGSIYGGLMQNFVGSTREGGIFFETNFTISNKMRLYPSVSVTTGEGQGFWDTQTDAGFKYGGRIDFMPMGDFIKNNAFIAQDIYREPTPKLGIGVAGSYNVKASNALGGGHGTVTGIYDESGNAAYADYRKLVVDAIFKYKGFAFVGEYTDASVYGKNLFTDAAASVRMSPAIASSKYNLGSGLNLQSSYVLKDGWAFEGRYSFVKPEFDTATSLIQKQDWFTIGINKYIMNNAFRIGINTTCIKQHGAIADKTTWISNLAVQLSF
ncbi:hypothetical protein [Pinibacter aurantiacus]|uniref:Porin n=1 Tax=Pinibacter aurantiacus TaxID=2851599 RepID=A0A9E2W5T7_9BACT|nr:hypothetical protein [Pinibacter aurantiacus]MBV4359239.1 hypothetical protein [Pinibacter aurantiacus]